MTARLSKPALLAVAAGLAASIALASARQDPAKGEGDDDAEEARLVGRQAFVDNCLICHGEDMTTRQRLTTKQWSAEVEKMVGWGSPVPPEQKGNLLAYLNFSFSDKAPPAPADLAPADDLIRAEEPPPPAPPKGDAARGGPLYAQHCATCHGPQGQGGDLGPRLVERPALRREALFHEVVRKGQRRMPGFASVLKPDAEDDLLAWLRSAAASGLDPR